MLGESKVGKTALLHQLMHQQFLQHYDRTFEDLFNLTMSYEGEVVNLHILDTPGGDDRVDIREMYLSNTRAFVIVYAIDDKNSFDSVAKILAEIKKARKEKDSAIILCANKKDLGKSKKLVTDKEEKDLEVSSGLPFFSTSAKDYASVVEAFEKLMELVLGQEDGFNSEH
eukprot:TRINITY_DN23271_c0_g1_i1.p1 TRINITY_DN23271_c0_g1~~TRINITY_DN23271_c0_g1_i1.p1  ORF type:complete len:197 (+),score=41.67 TRINITY_DN23271_c0_g1_i1:82-591(+)